HRSPTASGLSVLARNLQPKPLCMFLFRVAMRCWYLIVSLGLGAASPESDASCLDDEVTCSNSYLLQKSLHVQLNRHAEGTTKPWDVYGYLVATHHQAGSVLYQSIITRVFDYLGANYSCREFLRGSSAITSQGGRHLCSSTPGWWDCPIHWHHQLTYKQLEKDRAHAHAEGVSFKAVHSIRDPATMLAAGYCYHNRGDDFLAPWPDILFMDPKEGLQAVFPNMFKVMEDMTKIYENSRGEVGEVFNSRYENLTQSSQSFDANILAIFDFMFGGFITPEQQEEILALARLDDVNRGEPAYSAGLNLTENPKGDECMEASLAVLKTLDLYGPIKDLQERLGYA
ncbi:GIP, partial [Symbiodinium necroappetens]